MPNDMRELMLENPGAPECDSKKDSTRIPLSQTIDTWSLGCVFSSVATWVVLGSQAYENYSECRKIAIKALKSNAINDQMSHFPYLATMLSMTAARYFLRLRNGTRICATRPGNQTGQLIESLSLLTTAC